MSENPSEPGFYGELTALLNKYSCENPSGTPDWILAQYLTDCLNTWNNAVHARSKSKGEVIDATDGGKANV